MEVEPLPPGPGAVIFKRCRLRMGWSMWQVGDKVGVTKTAVSYWEMGSSWPTDRNLDALCVLFDLNYEDMQELKPDHPTLLAMKLQRGRKSRASKGTGRGGWSRVGPAMELLSDGNVDRSTTGRHGPAHREE